MQGLRELREDASCVSGEVCASSVIRKRKNLKKLLTRPASLEMAGNNHLIYNLTSYLNSGSVIRDFLANGRFISFCWR